MQYLLAIETSCDDTSVALIRGQDLCPQTPISKHSPFEVLYFKSFSQEYMLKAWGGVVPEIAARNHLDKIFPLLAEAMKLAQITYQNLSCIAVTQGPGLLGPLLTGINTAKALSLSYKLPLLGVNHLFAHVEAIHFDQQVCYPYLGCVISGGHTFFALVESSTEWKFLGSTVDDALGEALDKGGKLLGLAYPAGKYMDRLSTFGKSNQYTFPLGMSFDKQSCKVSYSGIKNALRVLCEKNPHFLKEKPTSLEQFEATSQNYYDLIASYMNACFDTLIQKIPMAYQLAQSINSQVDHRTPLVFGGGVAMSTMLQKKIKKLSYTSYFVSPELCTDNALMIATLAWKNKEHKTLYPQSLTLDAFSRYIDRKNQAWQNS